MIVKPNEDIVQILIRNIDKKSDTIESDFAKSALDYDGNFTQVDIDEARSRIGLLPASKINAHDHSMCADIIYISPAGVDAADYEITCCAE